MVRDRAQRLGAALAFYTLFALAPGLVILIPLTGVFLGPKAGQAHIIEQIEMIGRPGAEALEATIVSARREGAGVTVVAVITLVFGLWWVFGEPARRAEHDLGRDVPAGPGSPGGPPGAVLVLHASGRHRVLLLVSLAVSAWLAALGGSGGSLKIMPKRNVMTQNEITKLTAFSITAGAGRRWSKYAPSHTSRHAT